MANRLREAGAATELEDAMEATLKSERVRSKIRNVVNTVMGFFKGK
jgi:hypothetical protein